METEVEDAVTFLENVSSQYPNVPALLSKTQLLALDMDPKEPFDDTNVSNDPAEFVFTSGSTSYIIIPLCT